MPLVTNNSSIFKEIKKIPFSIIKCCEYHRDYFIHIQSNAAYYCSIYNHILDRAENALNGKDKSKAVIWDFGCGQGLLGLVASLKGWGHVGLIDMQAHCIVNVNDIIRFTGKEGIVAIDGNENDLPELLKKTGTPDVIISSDVIEHIYNIEHFLGLIKGIAPKAALIFTTGAVAENPLRAKPMIRLQKKDEFEETDIQQTADNNPYAGLSFLKTREMIIKEYLKGKKIDKDELLLLAKRTRGLDKKDIERAVDNYIKSSVLPKEIQHPTNTCDPMTSSWTERLLTSKEYKTIFAKAGYSTTFGFGLYNDITSKGIKKVILKLLNAFLIRFNIQRYGAYLLIEAKSN